MTRGRLLGTCWEGAICKYVYVQFTIVCNGGHLICAVCRAASGINLYRYFVMAELNLWERS